MTAIPAEFERLALIKALGISYRKGKVRTVDDPAYAYMCLVCNAQSGRTCAHKLGAVRSALVDALVGAYPHSSLGQILLSENSLEQALSRSSRYHQLVKEVTFQKLCDLQLAPFNAPLTSVFPESLGGCTLHPKRWCAERKEWLKNYLLDSLFPLYWGLIERLEMQLDSAVWELFLATHARTGYGHRTFTDTAGALHVGVGEDWAVFTPCGTAFGFVRLWQCRNCGQTVVQNGKECCAACGADNRTALLPLPQVLGQLVPGTALTELDVASDSLVWKERTQYSVGARLYQRQENAVAAAVRYLWGRTLAQELA